MPGKRLLLADARLYLVLDTDVCLYDRLFEILKQAADAGIDVIQLRDKKGTARDILRFASRARTYLKGKVPFIVNDRVDLAMAAGADGVHVGQEDLPVVCVRKIVGKKMLIGASCQTLEAALAAQKDGADYLGFGSVFKTLTKPERGEMDLTLLKQTIEKIRIPVFVIGGISLKNISDLGAYGVKRVAVTRAICLSDDVKATVRRFQSELLSFAQPKVLTSRKQSEILTSSISLVPQKSIKRG